MKISVLLVFAVLLAIISFSSANPPEEKHTTETKSQISGSEAGGRDTKGKTYLEHKVSRKGGKISKHDKEVAKHGSDTSHLHRVEDLEKGGKKHKHFHADKHESFHKSGGESAHGAKFEEASKRHKGSYKKGFLEKFHKDELMAHDSFFSNGEKSGTYNIYGKKGSKYGSQSVAKKAGGAFKNLSTTGKHGKSSKKMAGHNKADKTAHKSSKATKSNRAHGEKHARKGGKKGGK